MITLRITQSSGDTPAKLTVCDLSGRMVRTLINGPLPRGDYFGERDRTNESGNRISAGSHFLTLEQDNMRHMERLVVVN